MVVTVTYYSLCIYRVARNSYIYVTLGGELTDENKAWLCVYTYIYIHVNTYIIYVYIYVYYIVVD